MSIYGPTLETNQEENEQVDHSLYAKKPDVLLKTGGLMHGNIDMTGHKVVNLGDPTYGQDAATMRYVDTYATYLNNNKVNWAGGTMTGDLSMGDNKLTNVGDPENDKDAVNKKYVDTFPKHDLDLDVIGRYLVISKNGGKSYVSLRTKKNIDLQQDLLFNITSEGLINTQGYITNYPRVAIVNNLPNVNKLGTINFYTQLNISTQVQLLDGTIDIIEISHPWTFLFSAKPDPVLHNDRSFIRFGNNSSLFFEWSSGTFTYTLPNQNAISIVMDTTQLNHIAFEYVRNKLTVWVNGKSRKSHTIILDDINAISMDIDQLGVLSLYNRELSKTEVAEHFVEYQVKNFSNDEVLI